MQLVSLVINRDRMINKRRFSQRNNTYFGNRTMDRSPKKDILVAELERERSIRRTASLLYAKRSRIFDELDRLISHLSLLVAVPRKTAEDPQPESDILIEAAKRIDDPVFTDLLIQIIRDRERH